MFVKLLMLYQIQFKYVKFILLIDYEFAKTSVSTMCITYVEKKLYLLN